ncbi:ABC transporter permease [Arcticibacterium luteifluviistationis]|uniref:ABC transporter permease n=1 Tax=Arcticibacterium luteifluviistationis TaxID=1784714 RepID=A0A2Z4GF46_9BACT|nr:ABC transporter permease [Arcticibacterium luteifluviistationis]AWV99999.1 hypothetical protein DJ013_18235 [Arcticibacterium luteifluviistationis]
MIKNYFKIAWRNIKNDKLFFGINMLGLTVAFLVAIVLFLSAHFEFSYDNFQANKEQIYKVYHKVNRPEKTELGTAMPYPNQPALKAEFSDEIKYASRILDGGMYLEKGDKHFDLDVNFVDEDYFEMFSFDMLKGSKKSALSQLNNIVLTQETAESVFGEANPIGETVMVNFGAGSVPFTVNGVTQNAPENSSIENQNLVRIETYPGYKAEKDNWNSKNHDLYIQLAEGINYVDFEKRLKPFTEKYYQEDISFAKESGYAGDKNGDIITTNLLPFSEVHFDQEVGNHPTDPYYPYILLAIAFLVILISSINFINLSIAKAFKRSKEVGMRKALGATRKQLIWQFWSEALITYCMAFLLALAAALVLIPEVNALLNGHLAFKQLFQASVLITVLLSFVLITALAGGYPALMVSKFETVAVLKGKVKSSMIKGGLRNSLIVVQFTISIGLIAATFVIWNQINHLQNKPLGFDKEHVISIPVGNSIDGYNLLNYYRNALAGESQIQSISGSDGNLGIGKDNSSMSSVFGFTQEDKNIQTNGLNVDFDYIETMGLDLIAGRGFDRKYATDSSEACIINEAMAKQLGGIEGLVGKRLDLDEGKTIIGIVKDYHFESLHKTVEPLTLFFNKPFGISYVLVRTLGDSPAKTMKLLEDKHQAYAPQAQFQASFLNENTNNQYKKEQKFAKIFVTAASIAILLSSIGLFAIALMVIKNRTKEIGVRKVLGADTHTLVSLMSKDFLTLVVVAICIASPIVYYTMNSWLEKFPYRVDVDWKVLTLSSFMAILIAFFTVAFHAIKAANMNPVKSLKSE